MHLQLAHLRKTLVVAGQPTQVIKGDPLWINMALVMYIVPVFEGKCCDLFYPASSLELFESKDELERSSA